MKILVCVKQVPDAKDVRLDPKTNTLAREGVESIMNPYDRHALEEAVVIKEQQGGSVTVITMGPPQAEAVLREAVACGADEAVLVSDRAFAGADTWATSYTLAKAVEFLGGFDLILCGKQAIDGDTAQVGPGLARRLRLPYAACVQKKRKITDDTIEVERMMDDGFDVVRLPLPALITVVKDINEPRVASLKGKMRAKKVEIQQFSAAHIGADPQCIGLAGSPTKVVRVFSPEPRGDRQIFTGSIAEQVDQLVARLKSHL
ncbi:electron transfer flavoprotein subunit beta/FixA family protein [Desulfobulbus oligotrophicus]|jgi:electron transfer flavoprotein beta subunit|uniref:Electron transfer flavoprotein subunit beta/FixA family protein n=1 Tax=Desulfobulbus oligotrophicus TaxID=1909699 RepID=A0A7T6AR82_9BACT|nr:electron transfer flavoprotein subunit beta/FixA family protein [Desulfobulbus oligotrophicus]MDY0389831.1 electron transfer flavoprotein subunit beta/FixA family protein [Desulfobulbus oligotrophicus]QQG66531.1 electron transfer flavoprotein subunit beta/FixA family protein [Desulfobulbus oligotrophicus]